MLREVLTVSALILAVLLVRAVFKNRVPKRMVYVLWLVVLLKLCLPGTVVSLPVLPAEEVSAPVQRAETPARTAPVVQQPAQAAAQPQTPVQQPVSPAQAAAEPAAKPPGPSFGRSALRADTGLRQRLNARARRQGIPLGKAGKCTRHPPVQRGYK